MSRKMRVLFLVVAGAAITSSCREPTQARLLVSSTAACDNGERQPDGLYLTDAVVYVGSSFEDLTANENNGVASAQIPCADLSPARQSSLVLLPGKSSVAYVRVVAGTKRVSGTTVERHPSASCKSTSKDVCIRASRQFSYRTSGTVTLDVKLTTACLGLDCGVDATCEDGVCRSARCQENTSVCDGTSLPPVTSSPADAGPPDATVVKDAAVDAAVEPVGPLLFACEEGAPRFFDAPCFLGSWCYDESSSAMRCPVAQDCEPPAFAPCCKATKDDSCCLSKLTLHPIDVSSVKAGNRGPYCDPHKACFAKSDCTGGDTCHIDPRGAVWGYCGP